MNDFWKWMQEKGYGEDESIFSVDKYDSYEHYEIESTKQMLVGFMIEYLNTKDNLAKLERKRLLATYYGINEYEDVNQQLNILIEEINK